ncbi:MAG: LamG domain-containing protein [Phycisphaerae bacterium]|nr:LamG domain-containing protein [Phycisphaerae bacterium]
MLTTKQSKFKPPIGVPIHPAHPLARGLAGCWLLNEGGGATAHDASGRRYDGVFSGNPTWSHGPLGRTIQFDGTDDWITMGDCLDLGTDDITMLALVNYSAAHQPDSGHYGAIAGKGYLHGSSRGYGLYVDPSNKLTWQVRNLSSAFTIASNSTLNDGTWHLAVGVCDRDDTSGMRFFVDAVQQGTAVNATALSGIDLSGSQAFAVGSRQDAAGMWNWDFLGSVAMVCVWKRVLTDVEIRGLSRNPLEMLALRRCVPTLASGVDTFVPCTGSSTAATSLSGTIRVARNVTGTTAAVATIEGTTGETNLISLAGIVAGLSATRADLHVTTPPAPPSIATATDRAWLSGALLNGASHTAIMLGTTLTQGWFWVRRSGCTAVYRGSSLTQADLGRILYAGEPGVRQISLPTHLSHPAGSTHCYLVRRFNSSGRQEATWAAAAVLRITSNGQRGPDRPNAVHGLHSRPAGSTSLRLIWFYCPLDQERVPGQFNVYRSDATGQVDFSDPIAVVRYDGQRFYHQDCVGLADGENTFVVRAADSDGAEGIPSSIVAHRIEASSSEPPVILAVASF